MALYEFFCAACKFKFEQITRLEAENSGECPKCQSRATERLISRFAVGGQGDLRETTLHGCHDNDSGLADHHDSGDGSDHG